MAFRLFLTLLALLMTTHAGAQTLAEKRQPIDLTTATCESLGKGEAGGKLCVQGSKTYWIKPEIPGFAVELAQGSVPLFKPIQGAAETTISDLPPPQEATPDQLTHWEMDRIFRLLTEEPSAFSKSARLEKLKQQAITEIVKANEALMSKYQPDTIEIELRSGKKGVCKRGASVAFRDFKNKAFLHSFGTGAFPRCPFYDCGTVDGQELLLSFLDSDLGIPMIQTYARMGKKLGSFQYPKSVSGIDGKKFYESNSNTIAEAPLSPEKIVGILCSPSQRNTRRYMESMCKPDSPVGRAIEEFEKAVAHQIDENANRDLVQSFLTPESPNQILRSVLLPKGDPAACTNLPGPSPLSKDNPKPESGLKAVTSKELKNVFEEVKGMEDIAHENIQAGCEARAHLIGERLRGKGIHTEKIFILGDMIQPKNQQKSVSWGGHVATVVLVEEKPGEFTRMVIDPSLSDKALTPKEWVNQIKKPEGPEVYWAEYPMPMNGPTFRRTVVAFEPFSVYWPPQNATGDQVLLKKMHDDAIQTNAQALKKRKP